MLKKSNPQEQTTRCFFIVSRILYIFFLLLVLLFFFFPHADGALTITFNFYCIFSGIALHNWFLYSMWHLLPQLFSFFFFICITICEISNTIESIQQHILQIVRIKTNFLCSSGIKSVQLYQHLIRFRSNVMPVCIEWAIKIGSTAGKLILSLPLSISFPAALKMVNLLVDVDVTFVISKGNFI